MKWLLLSLGIAVSLPGQSQTRPATLDRVLTLPKAALPDASLTGIVVAETTGAPLAGATVTLSRHFGSALLAALSIEEGGAIAPVRTNALGVFSFQRVAAGSYDLEVRIAGYLPLTVGSSTTDGR